MEEMITPYELPEVENHSFFFIDQRIETHVEAKLHQHDAWELYYVLHGYGTRMAGDTLQSFSAGDVALIPPSMHHYWEYTPLSADSDGCVHYLMVAFSHSFVVRCMKRQPNPLFSPLYSRYFSLFKGMACQRKAPIPSKKPRISELRRQAILVMRTIVHQ